ncbi:hypothetical protein ACRALDRAFT_1076505 [Sodiomyces alcalophilus JCM 7366]|uniref:uncharacterized protein n=1 Tax=Sodiomyces alcalophilus JCM 7366 TaxID=591952 RepID=UPI0039B46CDA
MPLASEASAQCPSSRRRLSTVVHPDSDPYPYPLATHGNGTLATLIRNRSSASVRDAQTTADKALHFHTGDALNGHDHCHPVDRDGNGDDVDDTTPFLWLRSRDPDMDDAPPRRRTSEERRLSQLIFSPQMRSMRLIGNSNPRCQWERYWKTKDQLKAMPRALRQYYERNNDLIRMYLYIDQLLDSSVPHELLNEYCQSLDASAFRPVGAPRTISEEPPLADNATRATDRGNEPTATSAAPADGLPNNKRKRNPKDIFRSTETTPLLVPTDRDQAAWDEEEGRPNGDYPKPEIPWLEGADLDSSDPIVTIAIWVNLFANSVLLVAKIFVVASVPSVSVLASLVDAALDFLSTAIVWTTTRLVAASQNDQFRYPIGRGRLEPIGVLVFSIVMVTSFSQVALEAFQRLASSDRTVIQLGVPAMAVMISTVVIKGACWLWCRLVKNSSVRALADDAMTDVIFNTGSIFFPIVGFYAHIWWFDALGGLLLSLVVIVNWSQTSMHHVRNLTGFSATPDERNLLLYLTMRFSTAIKQIQNLRAYHAGDRLFVEVDIVLSADMLLKDSHDLSEVITYFLESVPIVDRAFVHVDYATYNFQTHINT